MKHLGSWLVSARLKFFGGDWPAKKKPRENLQKSSRNLGPRLQGKGEKNMIKANQGRKRDPF